MTIPFTVASRRGDGERAARDPFDRAQHGALRNTYRLAGGLVSWSAATGEIVMTTRRWISAAASALLAGACALEVQNTQPAQEMAQQARPAGSVYSGWRVFQDKCAACHGPAATGGERGPNLLPRVREMGAHRFVNVVLHRYDWSLPAVRADSESAAREALIDGVMRRQQGDLAMPAWEGEPRVNAHITDLYAYLSARAEGTQGPGRPTP
jgi:mono/diheme cytochrome c family protein